MSDLWSAPWLARFAGMLRRRGSHRRQNVRRASGAPQGEALESRRLLSAMGLTEALTAGAFIGPAAPGTPDAAEVVSPAALALRPPAPRGLRSSGIDQTSLVLAWPLSRYQGGSVSYRVYEETSTSPETWTLLTTVPAETTRTVIGGLLPDSTHVFAYSQVSTGGVESRLSKSIAVTTLGPPTISFPNPYDALIHATVGVPFSYPLVGTGNPAPAFSLVSGPAGMTVDSATGVISWTPTADQVGIATATVAATNSLGTADVTFSFPVAPLGSDTTAPSIVSNVVFSNPTPHGADLSWSPASDNLGVDHYRVLLFSQLSPTPVLLATVDTPTNATTFTLNNAALGPNSSYYVIVTAVDAAGNESPAAASPSFLLNTAFVDVTPPTVPTGLVATNATVSTVSLSWTASTDDVSVAGYRVYSGTFIHNPRGSGGTWHWALVADNVQGTQVTLTGLTQGKAYHLAVKAFDAAGNVSAQSATLNVSTLSPPAIYPQYPAPTQVVAGQLLVYTPSASGNPAPSFSLVNAPDGMMIDPLTGQVQWTPPTSLTGDIAFTIRATNAAGQADLVVPITVLPWNTDITPPSPVTNVQANNVLPTSFDLSWTPATDNVAVDRYLVNVFGQVGYLNQVNFTLETNGPVTELLIDDPSLVGGVTYTVTVWALDAANNISYGVPINVMTPAS